MSPPKPRLGAGTLLLAAALGALVACGGTPPALISDTGDSGDTTDAASAADANDVGAASDSGAPESDARAAADGSNGDAAGTSMDGSAAPAPPPLDVRASTDLAGEVQVTWTPPPHARPFAYVVERDGAPVATVPGAMTRYDDTTAPPVTLGDVTSSATADHARTLIVVRVSQEPSVTVAPVTYTARAVYAAATSEDSAPATGWRAAGATAYQWQRSAGDGDAAYADLPGVTGSTWVDDTAPKDGQGRYYRVTAIAPGAVAPVVSAATRASVRGATRVSRASTSACALLNDGSAACWGPATLPSNVSPPFVDARATRGLGAPAASAFSGGTAVSTAPTLPTATLTSPTPR